MASVVAARAVVTRPRSSRAVSVSRRRAIARARGDREGDALARALGTSIAVSGWHAACAGAARAEEISPFAGVVDVSVLLLVAFLWKLGNEKSAKGGRKQSKTVTSRAGRKK